jgi:hypothetical protein
MSTVRYSLARTMFGSACVALLLAGCGGDTNYAPFNPSGTSDDMAAIEAGFDSPVTQSFGFFAGAMDGAFTAPVMSGSLGTIRESTNQSGLFASARTMAASVRSMTGGGTTVALALIPAEYLGDTYVYDPVGIAYVLSDRTGAPANGVRFIVYAVNPISGIPTEPLQEIGYADLLDTSTPASDGLRVQLVSEGTTYLDYGVMGSGSATSARIVIDGFVTNGTTQVDFNLDTSLSDALGGTLSYDYELNVPTRDVSLDYLIAVTNVLAAAPTANVDLFLAGPNGSVGIEGGLTAGAGALTARVNGDDFAVMTMVNGDVASIAKPDGSALTLEEYGALFTIWGLVIKGFDILEDLLDPIDNVI